MSLLPPPQRIAPPLRGHGWRWRWEDTIALGIYIGYGLAVGAIYFSGF